MPDAPARRALSAVAAASLAALAVAHCGPSRVARPTTAARAATSAARGGAPTTASPPGAGAGGSHAPTRLRPPPRTGCDASHPSVEGFSTDDRALVDALRADARAPATGNGAPPAAEPTTELADGHVRLALPGAWFPARIAGAGFTGYQVRTGQADDAIGIYLGDAPAFRLHREGGFRLALGPIAVRGAVWTDHGRRRLEALALLPCAAPRYLHLSADTAAPERLARVVAALRSLRIAPEAAPEPREETLDPTRDAAAVAQLTAADPVARELATRALGSGGELRAAYPLAHTHPLAEQALLGRYSAQLGGVTTDVRVRIPVRDGRATAPALYRAVTDGTLAAALATLARASGSGAGATSACRAPEATVGHDGVAVRCAGEPPLAVAAERADDPAALPRAVERFAHLRTTLARWRRDPSAVGGWPASLCALDGARATFDAGALFVASDRCVLAVDPVHDAVRAAAFAGECAQVPANGGANAWSSTLRSVGRFDEMRGEGGTYCRYTLGFNGRNAWVIAVGDAGTASAPIAQGPVVAADPRGVNTAVAFVTDLVRFATGQATEPPANAPPSVLRQLGLDAPGSPASTATLRLLAARGGFTGAGTAAVLGARALDADNLEVTFMPLVVTVSRNDGRWVVSTVRPSSWAPP